MYLYILKAVVFYDSGLRTTNHLSDVEKQHDSLSVSELRPGGAASATERVALEAVRLSCSSDTNLYPGSEGGD